MINTIVVRDDMPGIKNMKKQEYITKSAFGAKEEMHWIPIKDLDQYKVFPGFLKDYLRTEHCGIEHIVTDERIRNK